MDFFDKLGANIANAGRTVSQTARNLSDVSSLRRDINNENRNIQQKYTEIGKLYFEKFNNDPGCDFFDEVNAILTSQRHIQDLEEQIQEVQNRRPELIPIPETTKYPVPQGKPSAMVCMQCGQTFDASQTYCSSCGARLTEQYSTEVPAESRPEVVHSGSFGSRVTPVQEAPVFIKPAEPTPWVKPTPVNSAPAENAAPAGNAAPADNTAPAGNAAPAGSAAPDVIDLAPDPLNPAPDAPRICLNCGAKAAEDSAFCAQCGTKLV